MSSVADALPATKAVGLTSQNPFEILSVYDEPDIELGVDGGPAPTEQTAQAAADDKKPTIKLDYKVEESESEQAMEAFMAFCTLFRDVSNLRTLVKKLWTSYANKELSLSSVSVATNTAVDLARRMEEDVSHLFVTTEHGVQGLLVSFYLLCCRAEGKDPEGQPQVDNYNMDTYGWADYTMSNSARLLKGWSTMDAGADMMQYNGAFGC